MLLCLPFTGGETVAEVTWHSQALTSLALSFFICGGGWNPGLYTVGGCSLPSSRSSAFPQVALGPCPHQPFLLLCLPRRRGKQPSQMRLESWPCGVSGKIWTFKAAQPTSQKAQLTTSGETIWKRSQPYKHTITLLCFPPGYKSYTHCFQNVWKTQQAQKKIKRLPSEAPAPCCPQGNFA